MKLSPVAIALSPLMALTAAPAFAEVKDTTSPDTIAIERMIVTGSRVPERLDEVPSPGPSILCLKPLMSPRPNTGKCKSSGTLTAKGCPL